MIDGMTYNMTMNLLRDTILLYRNVCARISRFVSAWVGDRWNMELTPNRRPDYQKATGEACRVLEDNYVLQPPVPIDEIVRNYDIGIFEAEFPGDFAQVSGFIDLDSKKIVLNRKDSIHRRVFTLAHELGHWLLHRELLVQDPDRSIVYRKPLGGPDNDPIEKEANCFAANLLVPDTFLRNYPEEDIAVLATLFGVSAEVIGYRLGNRKY